MKNIIEFSIQDFKDFILAQPDDRPIAMHENKINSECGCLLIHFARHHNYPAGITAFNEPSGASFSGILDKDTLMAIGPHKLIKDGTDSIGNPKVTEYVQRCWKIKIKNYREAKEMLVNLD